jgi:hypothetical protein
VVTLAHCVLEAAQNRQKYAGPVPQATAVSVRKVVLVVEACAQLEHRCSVAL